MSILKQVLMEMTSGVKLSSSHSGAIRDRESDGGGSIVGYFELVGVQVSEDPPVSSSVKLSAVAHFEMEGGEPKIDGVEVSVSEVGSAQGKKLSEADIAARLEQDKSVMGVLRSSFDHWLRKELKGVKEGVGEGSRFGMKSVSGGTLWSYVKEFVDAVGPEVASREGIDVQVLARLGEMPDSELIHHTAELMHMAQVVDGYDEGGAGPESSNPFAWKKWWGESDRLGEGTDFTKGRIPQRAGYRGEWDKAPIDSWFDYLSQFIAEVGEDAARHGAGIDVTRFNQYKTWPKERREGLRPVIWDMVDAADNFTRTNGLGIEYPVLSWNDYIRRGA